MNEGRTPPPGKLAENIMHFARLLRAAGLPVGPRQTLDAIAAVEHCGLANRTDFYWTLHAVLVRKHEHSVLFEQAFEIFWRRPKLIEQQMQLLFQNIRIQGAADMKRPARRRLAEALFPERDGQSDEGRGSDTIEIESAFTASAEELLQNT